MVPDTGLRNAATRFANIRAKLESFEPKPGLTAFVYEFLLFGFKQGWACLFGALILALLLGTHLYYPADAVIARYDFLTLAAVAIQVAMLVFKLESVEEAKVILAFHLVGTIMELFKTSLGSWNYPETSLLHIGAVPLFSGFMYASVGSYIARVWRIFEFRFDHFPNRITLISLASLIYINFFTHHWLPDIRIPLFMAIAVIFWKTTVWFKPFRVHRKMPMLIGFFLVAVFIWFAENISTFSNAWLYPDQKSGWTIVSPTKLGAWYLLMIISFVLVSLVQKEEYQSKFDT
jgi:uncharacterized membrane protein YoaT (DUF817 family)